MAEVTKIMRPSLTEGPDMYDRLLELATKLGSAESLAAASARSIELHTADCAEFRGKILERIEQNRVYSQERHDELVRNMSSIAKAQDKVLIRVSGTIIGLLLGTIGTLAMILMDIKLGTGH